MLPSDIGRRIRLPIGIEQDFGFRFLQTQPPGNPLESLDIVRRFLPTIGFVARASFQVRILRYRMPPEGSSPCRIRPKFGPLPSAASHCQRSHFAPMQALISPLVTFPGKSANFQLSHL